VRALERTQERSTMIIMIVLLITDNMLTLPLAIVIISEKGFFFTFFVWGGSQL
jgi:hypothetical protein